MTWQTWFAPLDFQFADDRLTVVAPSDLHARWIREKHEDLIVDIAGKAFGDIDVRFAVSSVPYEPVMHHEPMPTVMTNDSQASPAYGALVTEAPRLLPKYTFEDFVVGQSNRFAWAAAMAVAEKPGHHYNPLFIYGGAGLGKTHLLHAVGHHSRELNPRAIVRYVSSENFFNEFIEGIRRKRMDAFKARYRTTDVLLLDDVQFFEGKEQILEEFFHTFNSLYESGKQMVISCDRSPKHLSTLEDRLRSRFEWGLLTDIQPADVETRLAILRKNADFAPKPVPEDVLEFIALHVPDNIRELEGALTRVTAFAALTNQEISLDIAHEVLRDLVPANDQRPPTAEEIIAAAAAAYGYSPDDLTSPSRRQPLVLSRQIAMYLCRDLTDLSLPKIGKRFGGRDHSTVIYAVDKISQLIQTDHEVFEKVNGLAQGLRKT
jgi:chromosomal replication initiator protein